MLYNKVVAAKELNGKWFVRCNNVVASRYGF